MGRVDTEYETVMELPAMVRDAAAKIGGKLVESSPALFICCAVALGTCWLFLDYQRNFETAALAKSSEIIGNQGEIKNEIALLRADFATGIARLADVYEKQQVFNGQIVEALRSNTETIRDARDARMEMTRTLAEFLVEFKQWKERTK